MIVFSAGILYHREANEKMGGITYVSDFGSQRIDGKYLFDGCGSKKSRKVMLAGAVCDCEDGRCGITDSADNLRLRQGSRHCDHCFSGCGR